MIHPLLGKSSPVGITQRKIRIFRSNIASNRQPKKAFPLVLITLGDRIHAARFEKGLLLSKMAQKLQTSIAVV
jgi:hypothetical protein